MTQVTVRIIRTYDVPVAAEYGDTDERLAEKASESVGAEDTAALGADVESDERAVIVPEPQNVVLNDEPVPEPGEVAEPAPEPEPGGDA